MNDNITIFQFFHWYYPNDGGLWRHAASEAARLADMGITHVWLPPAYKSGHGADEPGYAVYDLFDLGEFDQKGSVRTKYGTKQEYLDCIATLQQHGLKVIADIVLNHKQGADERELIPVRKVNPENRNEFIGEEEQREMYTKFNFPGRKNRYSSYKWDWHSFTGISEDPENIYMILNEYANGSWEEMLEDEMGNYDYLMGADIEFRNPHVVRELKKWGKWYVQTTGIDGLRLDALKHINHHFYNDWLDYLGRTLKRHLLCIGEYWRNDVHALNHYIDRTGDRIQLFDVPLHFNFHHASITDEHYDMRNLFTDVLVHSRSMSAITFVDNHDTQPFQSLQSYVEHWFKPLAYAIILLREHGIPCIFYPAMYGASYEERQGEDINHVELTPVACLEHLVRLRRDKAFGFQRDFLDHHDIIGWTREGIPEREGSGMAVILSNAGGGNKHMEVGRIHAGKTFVDSCGGRPEEVVINEDGWGEFFVNDKSVSVWLSRD